MAEIWRVYLPALHDDVALRAYIVTMFENGYDFISPLIIGRNPSLSVRIYSFRRLGVWRVPLVLTPWMLSNLFIPDENPDLALPDHPADEQYALLGPLIQFIVLGTQHKAHLQYDSKLGHYLLQPLVLGMEHYADAQSVLTAWKKTMRQSTQRQSSRLGRNKGVVSRREFFTRLGTIF